MISYKSDNPSIACRSLILLVLSDFVFLRKKRTLHEVRLDLEDRIVPITKVSLLIKDLHQAISKCVEKKMLFSEGLAMASKMNTQAEFSDETINATKQAIRVTLILLCRIALSLDLPANLAMVDKRLDLRWPSEDFDFHTLPTFDDIPWCRIDPSESSNSPLRLKFVREVSK